jgi:hypothetical protein
VTSSELVISVCDNFRNDFGICPIPRRHSQFLHRILASVFQHPFWRSVSQHSNIGKGIHFGNLAMLAMPHSSIPMLEKASILAIWQFEWLSALWQQLWTSNSNGFLPGGSQPSILGMRTRFVCPWELEQMISKSAWMCLGAPSKTAQAWWVLHERWEEVHCFIRTFGGVQHCRMQNTGKN